MVRVPFDLSLGCWHGLMFVVLRSVPLCYVYPALLHYKAVARTRSEKWKDIAMIVFGMIAAAYTTVQTIKVRPFAINSFSLSVYLINILFCCVAYGIPRRGRLAQVWQLRDSIKLRFGDEMSRFIAHIYNSSASSHICFQHRTMGSIES